jgi:hypothetical protein
MFDFLHATVKLSDYQIIKFDVAAEFSDEAS